MRQSGMEGGPWIKCGCWWRFLICKCNFDREWVYPLELFTPAHQLYFASLYSSVQEVHWIEWTIESRMAKPKPYVTSFTISCRRRSGWEVAPLGLPKVSALLTSFFHMLSSNLFIGQLLPCIKRFFHQSQFRWRLNTDCKTLASQNSDP